MSKKKKLTRERLRKIIREEQRKLNESKPREFIGAIEKAQRIASQVDANMERESRDLMDAKNLLQKALDKARNI